MDLEKFFAARDNMFRAIEACINVKSHVPACMLSLAWIDALVGLEGDNGTEQTYTAWCDRYLNVAALGVRSADLWGARNGLLHSWQPASRASKNGKAIEIGWSWGATRMETLAELAKHVRSKEIAVVSVEQFFTAVMLATQRYFEEVVANPERLEATSKLIDDSWMATISPEIANHALGLYQRDAP